MTNLTLTTPSDREILITRDFNAPRALVFDCMSKPELVRRWLLGPPGWTMPVCEIDHRVGGRYRYVWRNQTDGREMGMGGVYREIVPPEKVVQTELFDHRVDEPHLLADRVNQGEIGIGQSQRKGYSRETGPRADISDFR
jgi:uncharacterized protein YndB with AHSA1/START domain